MNRLIIMLLCVGPGVWAQPKLTSVERIAAGTSRQWTQPRFSPDGRSIFFTTTDLSGVWRYSFAGGVLHQITSEAGSGGAFAVSPDGRQLVYRRWVAVPGSRERKQEIILANLADGTTSVVASARRLSNPGFVEGKVVYAEGASTRNLVLRKSSANVTILGIEDTKIALNRNGKKVLLDPLGNGHYIWPSLSPAKDRMVAYEMDRGAFVCDLNGKVRAKLGKRDAPVWTRDGRWLIYMDDRDDGHTILSSDLCAVSRDGVRTVRLTKTSDLHEMYPDCSPVENKIVCSSLDGGLYLMTYTMEDR